MFSYTYEMRYGDFKDFEEIKSSALLDLAQDVAIRHSDSCGWGLYKMREANMAWLMQGINLHIEKPLSPKKNITVHTAVRDMKGVVSDRGCIFLQDGEVCAKTVAAWFLFDGAKMRPIRIPASMSECYGSHDFGDSFFEFKKPSLFDAEKIYETRVLKSQIDTNRHLNNQKSAELLIDALPDGFEFADASILYKKAAYLGDVLSVCRAEIEGGYFIKLENEEGGLLVAATFLK